MLEREERVEKKDNAEGEGTEHMKEAKHRGRQWGRKKKGIG